MQHLAQLISEVLRNLSFQRGRALVFESKEGEESQDGRWERMEGQVWKLAASSTPKVECARKGIYI